MADFTSRPPGRGSLSQPNTQFTQVQARERPDFAREMTADAIASIAMVGGEAIAKGNAANLTGTDLSLEEVNIQADNVNAQIDAAFESENNKVGGPFTESRANEIKDAALTAYADNDRVLLALRDAGTISTTEARARRTLNLKKELSNPINALFSREFMNVAGDLTGGGGGAVNAMFALTPEEELAKSIQDEKAKVIAEEEGEITSMMMKTGKDRATVVSERAGAEEDRLQLERLAAIKTERELTGMELDESFSIMRGSASRGITAQLSEWSTTNGGNGLDAFHLSAYSQTVEREYQSMLEAINLTQGVSRAWRTEQINSVTAWKAGMGAMGTAYDQNEMDKKEIAEFETFVTKVGIKHAPELFAFKNSNPELYKVYLTSGKSLGKFLDVSLGGDRGTKFVDAFTAIRSASSFSVKEGGVESPESVMTMLDNENGIKYIEGIDEVGNEAEKTNLKQAYLNATPESLKTLNGYFAVRTAQKGIKLQKQVTQAMDIARTKMDGIRKSLVSRDLADKRGMITASQKTIPGSTPGTTKVWSTYLDFPKAMENNQDELMQMFRAVEKHPWAWEHVADDYVGAVDAFNGYMRGEWDFTPNAEGNVSGSGGPGSGGKTGRGGRVKAEAPVIPKNLDKTVIDFDGEQELRDLMDREAEGVPSEDEENRLIELLTQRKEIRDRARTGGKPVDPRTERAEPPAAQSIMVQEKASFEKLAPKLLNFEGGFQNDPEDRGNFFQGKLIGTNKGISAAMYKNLFGEEPTEEKMKALTEEDVKAVYKERYWDENRVGEMPPESQEIAFNMFVMTSARNATKAIQRAAGITETGKMDNKTLAALQATTPEEIWVEYHKYLKSLKSYTKFGKGWKSRYQTILKGSE